MICLDTSGYSHFVRGAREAVAIVVGASEILLPAIVLGELRHGFRGGKREEENEILLREFLADEVVKVAVVDEGTSRHYANILLELKRAGRPIPTNDVWIAALAAQHGATVVTYDEHFRHILRIGAIILERK